MKINSTYKIVYIENDKPLYSGYDYETQRKTE